MTVESLRRQIGIVLQDTFLFSDTVMNNIRYGRPDATDEDVIAAAQLAHADSFITRLPDGYQTVLGERRQRPEPGPAPADFHCAGGCGRPACYDPGRSDVLH